MAQKLIGGMPPDFDLPANFIVQLTAVDPTSGAVVSGVNISNVAIMAAPVNPSTSDGGDLFTPVGPFMLVPGPDS